MEPASKALWPFVCAPDTLQMRATAKEFNDTRKYEPRGEPFLFLMRREPDPTEAVPPRHVSTKVFFFAQPAFRQK